MARAQGLLDEYRRKRDFAQTSEPKGRKGRNKGRSFVVQMHEATRLHFDFRLEHDGVLKSWAVTKGPSLDPADKRLAVRTEDHPLDYGTFEGTIPKGHYGAGTVMLWDRGTWEPVEDIEEGFEQGKLKFHLFGERMKGGWTLVRMKPRKGEKRENWLLIKERDAFASGEGDFGEDRSIDTGRTMNQIENQKPARAAKAKPKGRAPALPKYSEPQLATLVDTVPSGDDWLFEMKYDGYRCIAAVAGEKVRLHTRNGHDWTDKFGAIAPALATLTEGTALIDGEICAFDAEGKTSFSRLKANLSDGGELAFFAFDLLEADGENLRHKPLTERKSALEKLIGKRARHDPLQLSPTIKGRGQDVLDAVCKAGHEGVIAKLATAPYRSGRSKTWLKIKCTLRQEFIIVGWSPSEKRRGAFASLLVATEEDGKLVYRGRVGTGFSDALREQLQQALDARARKTSPLDGVPREIARNAHWVRADMLAEIAYTEMTGEGVLRHPSFLGLREDKPAKGVSLETPAPDAAQGKDGVALAKAAGIALSSPDKVLFPTQGITKGDLAAYYAQVAPAMLEYVADRPLSLVRCPSGRAKSCFFQKHDTGGFSAGMKPVKVRDKAGKSSDYLYLSGVEGLIAGVQMGVLEFHIWGSRVDNIEKPDRMVFDIDPDEGLDFADVKEAAIDIGKRLDDLGLKSFPMVTGGKGIHVVVPLIRTVDWPTLKSFASTFAKTLAADQPDRYTATLSKAARKGKLFIDYLRNERGSTAIAPFSTRAREGAPVAIPVSWDELPGLEAANGFSLQEALERAKGPTPWDGYRALRQRLPAMEALKR